ncbi:MAG TPA: uracil-DNA glycosylase family protein [Calditrichia bacterium]|nr:uracil-DNA glycosylase family protein [Calditrichota bacterium]HQU72779.1 uracil-DNA glycosylase family protein [Calditrichia bacterium]HQV32802.1 uracil-DNA glycosylase family protein [Calditrichia bacterium]
MPSLNSLLREIRACTLCEAHLPLGPSPVLSAAQNSRILLIGQAPGKKVHLSGIPWDDASGDRLREWLGLSREPFYDSAVLALVPMGFCYPGTGKSGDLPPRTECREQWHGKLLSHLAEVRLTLLVGQYAQAAYLGEQRRATLTETVRAWRDYAPGRFPLPHPSPRNNIWLKKNPWFSEDLLPELRQAVAAALTQS